MKRIARPWKPLACCITALSHLAASLSVGTLLSSQQAFAQTANNAPDITLEDALFQTEGTSKKLNLQIPVGKTLLIPIAGSDVDGDALSYTVTSSNPKIMVRARTGRPHLKMKVDYAGDPGVPDDATHPAYPAFSGTLDFQLYRDWTPVTAGFIGGFAQSFFYSPRAATETTPERHTIFHRVLKDFVVQGGDPNGQLPDPPAPSEGGAIPPALERGPGFSFENEFDIPLLFSGRGQLAMANAGSTHTSKIFSADYIDYGGTNGSQFFVTVSSPRSLDIKHTIFGQLVRGWDILDKMQNVPVTAQLDNPRDPQPADKREKSRPVVDIKITETSLVPNFTDAVLVLSATVAGAATITVQVNDGKSGGITQKTFQVTATKDEFNTPPIFTEIPKNQVVAGNKISAIPVRGIDLEHDYFLYENRLLPRFFPRGQSNQGGNPMLVLPDSGVTSALRLGFWMRPLVMSQNSFEFTENENSQQGQRDRRGIDIAVDDSPIRTEAVPVAGTPGAILDTIPVASYVDSDPRRQPSSLTVSINWGDGTPASTGTITRDQSQPTLGAYQIRGSHTYARKGVYPVVATITSSKGLKEIAYSTAVITSGSVRIFGQKQVINGNTFSGRPLAFFTDTATETTAADYEATIDWGDGAVTQGEVKQTGAGELYVTGVHRYLDPETFSAAIRVHKKGTPADTDTHGWSTLQLTGFRSVQPHLPPFPMARLVGTMSSVIQSEGNPNTSQDDVYKPFRQTAGGQTTFNVALSLLNNGNKKTALSKIRFYLSADEKLNLAPEIYTEGTGAAQVTRVNPKDIPLKIGRTQKEVAIIPLNPGQGGGLTFEAVRGRDTRLFAPRGEDGTGYHLITTFVYNEPMLQQLPIDRDVVVEISPSLSVTPSSLEVTEYPSPNQAKKFKISFNRKPRNDVTIRMKMVNVDAVVDTSEAEFTDAPAASKGEFTVVYTPAMWNSGKRDVEVSVTGKGDDAAQTTDGTAFVQFEPAESHDALFHGRTLSFVRISNRDLRSFVQVLPVTLETKEAEGTGHTKTFDIKLMQRPTKNVLIPVVVADATEGQVSGQTVNGQNTLPVVGGIPTLTFTPTETYPVTRTITVTAVDDNTADGNQTYNITIGPGVSEDPRYHLIDPPDVTVTNVDNPPAAPSNP